MNIDNDEAYYSTEYGKLANLDFDMDCWLCESKIN